MIIEKVIQGSIETSLHNFTIQTVGMQIIISPGEYYRAGKLVFQKNEPTVLQITENNQGYFVSVTQTEIGLFPYSNPVLNLIDNLAWFSVKDETDLNEIEINVVKIEPYKA